MISRRKANERKGADMKKPYTDRDGEVRKLGQDFFVLAKRGRPSTPLTTRVKPPAH